MGVTIKMQQYVSMIVTICTVDSSLQCFSLSIMLNLMYNNAMGDYLCPDNARCLMLPVKVSSIILNMSSQ